jgi:hypothetical protein
VTLRWPLIGSLVALVAGAGLAALVLAFCGGGEGQPSTVRSPTRTPLSRTVTVTRTPRGGTPVSTGTPGGTPSAVTPSADTATPSGGAPPPEETPEAIPPPPSEETATPAPEPTLAPGETPPAPSPTGPAATSTPVPPTLTPLPTATPTPPPALPDLAVLDISVSNDVLGVMLANQGHAAVPAGQKIEFRVRGVMAEAVTLADALPAGASVPLLLEDQVIYTPEVVLVVVDPNNLIPEEDEGNNGFAKPLAPDVTLDLRVQGVFRSADTIRLLVVLENHCDAPMIQVQATVTVFRVDATEPITEATYQLTIEPHGFQTVEVPGVAALPGVEMRVDAEMTNLLDADPSNNVWVGFVS